MKKANHIINEINKLYQAIKDNENKIIELDNREAIREAIQENDREKYKNLAAARVAKENEIAALSEQIYIDKVTIRVLWDNYNAAIYNETCEAIKEALTKYNGKPAGEKTTEKVRNEIKEKTGYRVYIRKDEITIYADTRPNNDGVRIITKYDTPFLIDNKYNAEAIDGMHIFEKYIENPKKEAKKLVKLYNKAREAFEAYEKARNEYNHSKPRKLPEIPYNTTYMYRTINI